MTRLPCMTTPAPDEHGRPAPKKVRGKIQSDTRQRWLDGGRQWATWRYDQEAMLTDSTGQLVLPLKNSRNVYITIPCRPHFFGVSWPSNQTLNDAWQLLARAGSPSSFFSSSWAVAEASMAHRSWYRSLIEDLLWAQHPEVGIHFTKLRRHHSITYVGAATWGGGWYPQPSYWLQERPPHVRAV